MSQDWFFFSLHVVDELVTSFYKNVQIDSGLCDSRAARYLFSVLTLVLAITTALITQHYFTLIKSFAKAFHCILTLLLHALHDPTS